jgi:hypothetical protein
MLMARLELSQSQDENELDSSATKHIWASIDCEISTPSNVVGLAVISDRVADGDAGPSQLGAHRQRRSDNHPRKYRTLLPLL